jgi:hypothetical protein
MRVAVIHDWLNGMRGGERVLEALLELYPSATIYTLFHERGKLSPLIESHPIVTSWLNRIPGIYRYYRNLLPLFPSAVESFHLEKFDLVISSSHAVAKGVRCGNSRHICYCHTPMRYVWDAENDYAFNPVRQLAMALMRKSLRQWDRETAARVDHFIANSEFVSASANTMSRCRRRLSPIDTTFSSLRAKYATTSPCGGRHCPVSGSMSRLGVQQPGLPSCGAGIGPELARLCKPRQQH